MNLGAFACLEKNAALADGDVVQLDDGGCDVANVEGYGVDFRPAFFGRGCYVIAANLEVR